MWRGLDTWSCLRMTLPFRLVKGMDRITFIKQEGLKHPPGGGPLPPGGGPPLPPGGGPLPPGGGPLPPGGVP